MITESEIRSKFEEYIVNHQKGKNTHAPQSDVGEILIPEDATIWTDSGVTQGDDLDYSHTIHPTTLVDIIEARDNPDQRPDFLSDIIDENNPDKIQDGYPYDGKDVKSLTEVEFEKLVSWKEHLDSFRNEGIDI